MYCCPCGEAKLKWTRTEKGEPLWFGVRSLRQPQDFRYIGVLLITHHRMERMIDRWIGASSVVTGPLLRSVSKKELTEKQTSQFTYPSTFWPSPTIMTCGSGPKHKQPKVAYSIGRLELCHPGGAQREKSVEVVLGSHQHAPWAPPNGGFPGNSHNEKRLGNTLNSPTRQYIPSGLGTLWDPQNELMDVVGERDIWGSLLDLLPQRSNPW